jgi:hypothetical protein
MSIVSPGAVISKQGCAERAETFPSGAAVSTVPSDCTTELAEARAASTLDRPCHVIDKYISGYRQLSERRGHFYPIRPDKSPNVKGKLASEATADPMKISFWINYQHHRSFALRIPRGCRLLVIDTESAFKYADKVGPDGELVFCDLLLEFDIELPDCPFVQTPTDGRHRYFLVPNGYRIRSSIGLWPGVDILAVDSSVILPGSRTHAGKYLALRSFEECPIPFAPVALVKLIRKTRLSAAKSTPKGDRIPTGDSVVSLRQWHRLFRNRMFRSFWEFKRKIADATPSAYEYHLAKACFCCGLNQQQTGHVIQTWFRKHGLERSIEKLRSAIIPAAWREVAPWVTRWRAHQAAASKAREATKTANMILAYMREAGTPQMPASVARALPIPRERAKKAMQRMAERGVLRRTDSGYEVQP